MSETPMRVVVVGAAGRMGLEAMRALSQDAGFEVVAAVVREAQGRSLRDLGYDGDLPVDEDVAVAVSRTKPDVVLDLSRAANASATAQASLGNRIPLVSGVTGISEEVLREIRELADRTETPAMIVPNFAIGAVLMMKFAELAARWIPDAEVIELHHEKKEDAPSGTAMLTAQRIARARVQAPTAPPTKTIKAEGARGGEVEGVPVHSIRLPGLLAHQEVMFGAPGEVLTLRHDAADRSVYMPGVKLCLRKVRSLHGLTTGMDRLLFDEPA
ncbi:4-hydroxy-tetrahydrodipicolinate reductase [Fimbriimonas ginsengisoli]|uniref:4-hydroxy-tetrahydrodipicolinate reductase n=1 Tax=Fimbriimonas ginsengisoli Gsoil 348 TaxID=661478 RepID=A0A068NJI5_FIMGI|nr:4-hydroxy-tetrahydrodipicolinate reductase [Fimbriimonas ginsengisoli]AIE83602.1 dihydrodipicolinate reductase [Fimbriimonas ginsengisoli Gsoil 348]